MRLRLSCWILFESGRRRWYRRVNVFGNTHKHALTPTFLQGQGPIKPPFRFSRCWAGPGGPHQKCSTSTFSSAERGEQWQDRNNSKASNRKRAPHCPPRTVQPAGRAGIRGSRSKFSSSKQDPSVSLSAQLYPAGWTWFFWVYAILK